MAFGQVATAAPDVKKLLGAPVTAAITSPATRVLDMAGYYKAVLDLNKRVLIGFVPLEFEPANIDWAPGMGYTKVNINGKESRVGGNLMGIPHRQLMQVVPGYREEYQRVIISKFSYEDTADYNAGIAYINAQNAGGNLKGVLTVIAPVLALATVGVLAPALFGGSAGAVAEAASSSIAVAPAAEVVAAVAAPAVIAPAAPSLLSAGGLLSAAKTAISTIGAVKTVSSLIGVGVSKPSQPTVAQAIQPTVQPGAPLSAPDLFALQNAGAQPLINPVTGAQYQYVDGQLIGGGFAPSDTSLWPSTGSPTGAVSGFLGIPWNYWLLGGGGLLLLYILTGDRRRSYSTNPRRRRRR